MTRHPDIYTEFCRLKNLPVEVISVAIQRHIDFQYSDNAGKLDLIHCKYNLDQCIDLFLLE